MTHAYRRFLSYLIPLIVAFSTSVIVTHQAKNIALSDEDNANTFYSFAGSLTQYKDERQEWKTRIFANFLAGRLVHVVEKVYQSADRETVMPRVAAIWSFQWLFLANIVFVIADRERALLYIFGTFTAVMFAYTAGIGAPRIYPWDLTSLFFFCCSVALIKRRREPWLLLLIPIATLFKETALLLVVALLFWHEVPSRRRLTAILATLLTALLAKGIVDVVTDNPSPIITMTLRDGPDVHRYVTNLQHLLSPTAWTSHPLFINAGLLVSLLILPMGDRRIKMLKVIAILFVLGNFFFGNIIEYRIWFELIPLSLYAIEIHFFGPSPSVALAENRRSHIHR